MSGDLPAVYLALGSNLGARERNLSAALQRIEPLVRVEAVSPLYETEPVPPGQPPYLNAVCRAVTGLGPRALLRHIKEVEREVGRRGMKRWAPRPIDIDLLLYGDLSIDEDGLRVPHARLTDRAFVLIPLNELANELVVPGIDRTVRELASECDASQVRFVADPGWVER